MNEKFKEALQAGKALIRKIWVNENSSKNQVSVQVQQRVVLAGSAGAGGSVVVAATQGLDGSNYPTNILSFEKGIFEKAFGSPVTEMLDYSDGSTIVEIDSIFKALQGEKFPTVNIQIMESLEPNENVENDTPKVNPQNDEILAKNVDGNLMPIYRRTMCVAGKAEHVLIPHTDTISAEQVQASVAAATLESSMTAQ